MDSGGPQTEFWVRLGLAILAVVVAWIAERVIKRSIRRFSERNDLARKDPGAETRFRMISRLTGVVLFFVGFGLAFWIVDLDTFNTLAAAMFASAGVIGIAVAIASQAVIANLVSGIIIAFVQPVRIGDAIDVDGQTGTVHSIGLFYSTIRVWENRHLLIPNKLLSDQVVHNYTLVDPRMVAVVNMRVDYGADVPMMRSLLLETARKHPSFLEEPEPTVRVVDADGSGLSVRLKAWAPSHAAASALAEQVRETVTSRLQEVGATVGVMKIRILSGTQNEEPPSALNPEPQLN